MDRCCSDNDDVPRARESLVHAYLQGRSKMLHLRTQVDVQLENKNVVTVCFRNESNDKEEATVCKRYKRNC